MWDKHNDELRLDASREERDRRAERHKNWVITQKAEHQRLVTAKFEAFYKAMNPTD